MHLFVIVVIVPETRNDYSAGLLQRGNSPASVDSVREAADSDTSNMNSHNTKCCGQQAYNKDTQLCCGPDDDNKILQKESNDHLCCGHNQFDNKKEWCCTIRNDLHKQPINSCCCEKGVQPQKPQPDCCRLRTSLCGSSYYKFQWCCGPGQPSDASAAFYPHTDVSCGCCVSDWKPWTDHFRGPPGHRSCNRPHAKACCNGPRPPRSINPHFCGSKAYDIKDPRLKCCAGILHNLTNGHEAQCCGSILRKATNVCCLSEHMEVLYSAKTGFECCGHLYYNSSLWSCCAGMLRPVPQPGKYLSENITKESILLSLGNLKKTDLCTKLQVGIVESVFLPSIVFNSVVEIHGWNASVTPLPSSHILKTATDCCSNPKLVPGKSYFFDKVKGHVFIDFNHDSILQSIYFIISKCYGNI